MEIYVGNLSYDTSEGSLRETFERFGDVSRATVVTDRITGRSRGFGFVAMDNSDQARSAIESLNGTYLDGRPLTVNEARPRQPRQRSGGGGGYGSGGGYGGDRY